MESRREEYGALLCVPLRWLVLAQACLTAASLWLGIRILAEPFVLVIKSQVWTLVALPAFLACLQAQVLLSVGARLVREPGKRGWVAALLVWSLLGLWFLLFVPHAYIGDIAKFQAEFRSSTSSATR